MCSKLIDYLDLHNNSEIGGIIAIIFHFPFEEAAMGSGSLLTVMQLVKGRATLDLA